MKLLLNIIKKIMACLFAAEITCTFLYFGRKSGNLIGCHKRPCDILVISITNKLVLSITNIKDVYPLVKYLLFTSN